MTADCTVRMMPKRCPRCTFEDAEPKTGICRYCMAAIERARDAVLVAMSEATATAGWLQREDGSWAPVDERGMVGPTFAIPAMSLLDEPDVIDVEPLYSPELRDALELAVRIAREAECEIVEIEHVRDALDRLHPQPRASTPRGSDEA
ncbi:hypothetical protein [Nocardia sp. NBC_00403]|uniref:hypothetical protein n=1 Tax=Nocardia sp. NBC_00403 TaxID=2975990 RepID=UPI002E1A6564